MLTRSQCASLWSRQSTQTSTRSFNNNKKELSASYTHHTYTQLLMIFFLKIKIAIQQMKTLIFRGLLKVALNLGILNFIGFVSVDLALLRGRSQQRQKKEAQFFFSLFSFFLSHRASGTRMSKRGTEPHHQVIPENQTFLCFEVSH